MPAVAPSKIVVAMPRGLLQGGARDGSFFAILRMPKKNFFPCYFPCSQGNAPVPKMTPRQGPNFGDPALVPSRSERKAFDIQFGRHDSPMRAFEPGLQLCDAFRDGGEIMAKTRHDGLDRVVDRRLVDSRQRAIPNHDGAIDDDVPYAAAGLDVYELPGGAVHRRPARIAHVDQCEVRLEARGDAAD